MNNKLYGIFAILVIGLCAFAQNDGTKEDTPYTGPRGVAALNDACATPEVITAMGPTAVIDTTGHTDEIGDPDPACSCCGLGWNGTTWYTFTPTLDGLISIDVCAATYDTTMEVYTGTCGAFTPVACNDDDCGLQSGLTMPVLAGTTYTICVGDWASGPGGGDLSVNLSGDDVFAAVAADVPTMSSYALYGFIALFAVAGLIFLRRKS